MRSRLVGLFAIVVLTTSACSSDTSTETTTSSTAAVETTVASAPDSTAPVSLDETTTATSETEPSEPASTEPGDDCVVVPANVATFELKITDDGVLYNAAPVPACIRAAASQALSVVNNAEADANIMLGSQAIELFAGDSVGDVVSTYGEVGESFDVYVTELDTTVIVKVSADA